MANVFERYQVTYLVKGGSDWDKESLTLENASNQPQIGEGIVLSLADDKGERAFRIVDVWTVVPKRGGLEYGVYAFIEEVPFDETPLPSWGQGHYN